MKKLLFIIFLLIPFFVYAEDLSIKSITLDSTTGNAEELSSSSLENQKLKLNIKLYDPGDSITYKITIENKSNEEVELNTPTVSATNEYIEYITKYADDSNIIQPNSEKTLNYTIKYKNKVPAELLTNATYNKQENIIVNVLKIEDTQTVPSPNTLDNIDRVIIIAVLGITAIYFLTKGKKSISRYSLLIMISLISIPLYVYAKTIFNIEIETNITIDGKEANFITGEEFNIIVKQLANNDNTLTSESYDYTLKAIRKSNSEAPEENKTLVSTSDSPYPIYIWIEDNNLYWWSEDKTPNLNQNAAFMFRRLCAVEDIQGVENFDTSKTINMDTMFGGYTAEGNMHIKSLKPLKKWDVSNVTNISGMFQRNIEIDTLEGLEDWDTSNVELISNLFTYVIKVKNLDPLAHWNTSKVTTLKYTFATMTSLENIDGLANWDTSNVEDMFLTFGIGGETQTTSKITSLEALRNWDTSKVTDMTGIFQRFNLITSIEPIENWDTSSLEIAIYMFNHCQNLENVNLSKWDTSKVTDMSYMFNEMTSLEELDISSFDTRKVTTFKKMFNNSTSLKNIYVGENWDTSSNTGEATKVFPTSCFLPNFDSTNSNRQNLSYAHTGEGGYLTDISEKNN